MSVLSLGYVGFYAPRVAEWIPFGSEFLGLQLAGQTDRELRFRMDDWAQRVVIHQNEADPRSFFGFEVTDAAALDTLAGRLEAAQVAVVRGSAADSAERCVTDLIAFEDPAGNRLEAFYGALPADAPFVPGRTISGFKTGSLGVGHIVLTTPCLDADVRFYTEVLGFRVSDYNVRPFRALFFHVNARHHTLALAEAAERGVHHLMVEMYQLDDVGQAYDLALGEPGRIATTLGRHTNDYMTSFYSNSPSGLLVETGWGGRTIDPTNWKATEMSYGPSFWGHERHWLPADGRAEARALRLRAAADGVRAPVQVSPGNYELTNDAAVKP